MSSEIFTGYDYRREPRQLLTAQCIDFDFGNFVCSGDIPETRGIKDLMRRDDQYRMNSCAGLGCTHAGEVSWWLNTGVWRQFAPHWTYTRGQRRDGIRGDNGATIHNVVVSGKEDGFLPEDVDNDGREEFPYPRDNYAFQYPPSASEHARHRRVGYSVELRSWDACKNFLQAGQGAIVIGGPWGNWRPNSAGICDNFEDGGGGHARAYIDWITINGRLYLVEVNSHFRSYGVNGFAFHSERFISQQFRSRWFVAIGISDISLGPGDKPKQRRHRRFVKLT